MHVGVYISIYGVIHVLGTQIPFTYLDTCIHVLVDQLRGLVTIL